VSIHLLLTTNIKINVHTSTNCDVNSSFYQIGPDSISHFLASTRSDLNEERLTQPSIAVCVSVAILRVDTQPAFWGVNFPTGVLNVRDLGHSPAGVTNLHGILNVFHRGQCSCRVVLNVHDWGGGQSFYGLLNGHDLGSLSLPE
jgi:hypothetical protein